MEKESSMYYVHKHQVALEYAGPEEGGRWYEVGIPTGFSFGPLTEEQAYSQSRALNELEHKRQKEEEEYEYTSVLAKCSTHFAFSVHEHSTPKPYPEFKPHYE